MCKNTVFGLLLALFVVGMLMPAFDIHAVGATETIFDKADGRIHPPTLPTRHEGSTYALTKDMYRHDTARDEIATHRHQLMKSSTLTLFGSEQSPFYPKWAKTYGGTGNDEASCFLNTSDGGYLVGGSTYSAGYEEIYLVKLDSSYHMQWNRTYAGGQFRSVVATDGGGYLLLALGSWYGQYGGCAWLIQIDSLGNVRWSRAYVGYGEYDELWSAIRTNDGGYLLAGAARYLGPVWHTEDGWLLKVNATGDVLWSKTYNGWVDVEYGFDSKDEFCFVRATNDGGYVMAGNIWGIRTMDVRVGYMYWLVKVDSGLNVQWNTTFGRAGVDCEVSDLVIADDGGYLLAGNAGVIKVDENGTILWTQTTYPGVVNGMLKRGNGRYLFCGCTEHFGSGGSDVWLAEADASGELVWNLTYGGAGDDAARVLIETAGGYALAGWTSSSGLGGTDFLLVTFGVISEYPRFALLILTLVIIAATCLATVHTLLLNLSRQTNRSARAKQVTIGMFESR